MKFLFDENISYKIVKKIKDIVLLRWKDIEFLISDSYGLLEIF